MDMEGGSRKPGRIPLADFYNKPCAHTALLTIPVQRVQLQNKSRHEHARSNHNHWRPKPMDFTSGILRYAQDRYPRFTESPARSSDGGASLPACHVLAQSPEPEEYLRDLAPG